MYADVVFVSPVEQIMRVALGVMDLLVGCAEPPVTGVS